MTTIHPALPGRAIGALARRAALGLALLCSGALAQDHEATRARIDARAAANGQSLEHAKLRHPACGKAEKLDRGARGRRRRDEIDAAVLHGPVTPVPRIE